jgi:hypothetical protein
VLALYVTGGTCGPPIWPVQFQNALGYRLGFQSFLAADLLVICALGCLAQWPYRPLAAGNPGRLTRPSPLAARVVRIGLAVTLALLGLLLCAGAGIVTWRLRARSHQTPVAYPDLNALSPLDVLRGAQPMRDITSLRGVLYAHDGARVFANAMSSGFVWNPPGQQRSLLRLYQQENVQPISMHPRQFDVEVSRQLPEREWMNRQGAWLVRSFADTAQLSSHPYYLEMTSLQAFIPLSADGKSYDTARAMIFPLAKSATQLVASGEMAVHGTQLEWSQNSGTQKYPRRFSLRPASAAGYVEFTLDLKRTRGKRSLRFGLQLEAANHQPRIPQTHAALAAGLVPNTPPLWQSMLDPADPQLAKVEITPADDTELRFLCVNMQPTDTLWFYELVLTADDFTP